MLWKSGEAACSCFWAHMGGIIGTVCSTMCARMKEGCTEGLLAKHACLTHLATYPTAPPPKVHLSEKERSHLKIKMSSNMRIASTESDWVTWSLEHGCSSKSLEETKVSAKERIILQPVNAAVSATSFLRGPQVLKKSHSCCGHGTTSGCIC